MDMCAKSADANLLNGYALNGYVLLGYVLNGYVLVGYVLVGYVWNGYVWDMCGVRYANNLLKNPATKRLSGKNPVPVVAVVGPYHWTSNVFEG